MSRAGRRSLVALCVVLALLGLVQPDRSAELSATTWGATPVGYGALYDLLVRLDLPVSRWFAPAAELPAEATVWWLNAGSLCAAAADAERTPAPPWSGAAWLAGGGTAVVLLGGETAAACASIAGVAVPARQHPPAAPDDAPPPPADDDAAVVQILDGPLVAAPRHLPLPPLARFESAGEATVLAQLDGLPFVVSTAVGAGRLVLVADGRPLRNRYLDRGDAAVFAVDLVRALGVPRFDERASGFHHERDALRYLARSAALPALLGIVALGGLIVWHGHRWPPRRPVVAPAAPTLGAFVDSLAALYARTGDYAAVAERYRQLTAARLRRHFGLPPETPLPALLDRLRASRRAELTPLTAPPAVADAAQLAVAVRALDALVRTVTR